jgi:hypothetical protein
MKTAPKASKNALWNCHLEGAGGDLTVGQKFKMSCEGPTEGIHADKLEFRNPDLSEGIPSLTLLQNMGVADNHAELVVTSYHVGSHKADSVILFDGEHKIDMAGPEWTLKSILKQDPTNPPQPFPAFPMVKLSYPTWFWVVIAVAIVIAIVEPYLQFQKIKKRKKQFEDLKNLESAVNPLDAFFKEMRKLEKYMDGEGFSAVNFSGRLQKEFLVFLSRSFQLPIHLWKDSQALREIKKKYPKIARDHQEELKTYLAEFEKSKKDLNKKDCDFLQREAQKLVEAIDASLEKYHRGNK